MHAEHHALRKMVKSGIKVKNVKIYVIRLAKDRNLRMSKPCDKCQELLDVYRIKKIYYSTDRGAIIKSV